MRCIGSKQDLSTFKPNGKICGAGEQVMSQGMVRMGCSAAWQKRERREGKKTACSGKVPSIEVEKLLEYLVYSSSSFNIDLTPKFLV